MKTKFVGAVAMLALFGLVEPSSAQFSSGWSAQHKSPYYLGPGDMRVGGSFTTFTTGEIHIAYDFTFKLAEDSDGIYPAAEVVEIEVPGELNPDGSESAAFVISIPIGSFQEGPVGFFYTWNPDGLRVSQQSESYVWDFVEAEGIRRGSSGVRTFWSVIHQRDPGEVLNMSIRMIIRDNRYSKDRFDIVTVEPTPKFLELLFGGPTLNIGSDGWESQPYHVNSFLAGPYSPPD